MEETPYYWDIGLPLVADRHFFSPGEWTFRRQGPENWLLKVCLTGGGAFRLRSGELARTGEREVYLIEPEATHDFGSIDNRSWDTLWCHFIPRPEWRSLMSWSLLDYQVYKIRLEERGVWEALVATAREVIARIHGPHMYKTRLAQNGLEKILLVCSGEAALQRGKMGDERIERVKDYLSRSSESSFDLERAARQSGLSVSRLCHLFKEETGKTVHAWWEGARMERAKLRLATTGEPISSIAYGLGFKNPYYFSNRFKRMTGMSPTEFRRGRVQR